MADVRDPLLADLLRRLLTDPDRELDLQVIEGGDDEDDRRLRLAVTGRLELSGVEICNLKAAVPYLLSQRSA